MNAINTIHLLIGGERRNATGGATFERRNPLDHAVATRAPAATAADAVAAVDAAAAAFPAWAAIGPGERRALLMKAAHALEARADAFAAARPKALSLAQAMAASVPRTRTIAFTGAKVSSW